MARVALLLLGLAGGFLAAWTVTLAEGYSTSRYL
jgi:hypothetical protein